MAIIECPNCNAKISDKAPACNKCSWVATISKDAPFDFKNASKEMLSHKFKDIAKEIGDDRFFTKKELHYLPEILKDGEQVLAFTSGVMDGNTWLITLTERRIIFLDKGMLFGLKQSIIDLDKVNSVTCSTRLLLGDIVITDGARDRIIKNVSKMAVKNFTNKVQDAIDNLAQSKKAPGPISAADRYDQLEKLSRLKDSGVLTADEFTREKARLLSDLA